MKSTVDMERKTFYLIVGLCAAIIMISSMESFIRAKDNGLFEAFINNPNINIDRNQSTNDMYSIYLTNILSVFLIRVIAPITLSLNSYISLVKIGVNKLFVYIWTVIVIGTFLFTTLGEGVFTLLFILSALCNLGLVIVLFKLWKEIDNKQRIISTTKKTQY